MKKKEIIYKPDRESYMPMLYKEMMHYTGRIKLLHRITDFATRSMLAILSVAWPTQEM